MFVTFCPYELLVWGKICLLETFKKLFYGPGFSLFIFPSMLMLMNWLYLGIYPINFVFLLIFALIIVFFLLTSSSTVSFVSCSIHLVSIVLFTQFKQSLSSIKCYTKPLGLLAVVHHKDWVLQEKNYFLNSSGKN